MAVVRSAHTVWTGDLSTGSGDVTLDTSGVGTYPVTWKARTEAAGGKTSPEELIGAAHSACFSMQLSFLLEQNGTAPTELETTSEVSFQVGKGITGIALKVVGTVPGVSADEFGSFAEQAKTGCPVSQALKTVPMTLEATLKA